MAGRGPKTKGAVPKDKKDKGGVGGNKEDTDPWVTITMLPIPSGKPDRRVCFVFQCKRESIQRLTKEVKKMFRKSQNPDLQFSRSLSLWSKNS